MTSKPAQMVPHRSLQRYFTDSLLGALSCCLAGIAANYLGRAELSLVAGLSAFVIVSLLSSILAPYTGAVLMPREESRKRHLLERAETPILNLSFLHAAEFSSYALALGVASNLQFGFELEAWIAGAAFVTGAAFGAYLSMDARRELSTVQNHSPRADEGPDFSKDANPKSSRSLDGLLHHYIGYTLGLASALLTASFVGNGKLAAFGLLAAFLLTKLVTDATFPGPRLETNAKAGILRKLMWVIIAFPAGIALWGLPIATLAVIIAHTYDPALGSIVLLQLFASVAGSIGALATLMTGLAYAMNLVPESEPDTQ